MPALTRVEVEARLARLVGPQLQTPPMFSAVHVGGKRLYELARLGMEVDRPARQIEILALDLRQFAADRLTLSVVCTTGTYIRTLAEDVAKALGTVGHVARLHRLWVEPFRTAPMHTLEALERIAASGAGALAQLRAAPGASARRDPGDPPRRRGCASSGAGPEGPCRGGSGAQSCLRTDAAPARPRGTLRGWVPPCPKAVHLGNRLKGLRPTECG